MDNGIYTYPGGKQKAGSGRTMSAGTMVSIVLFAILAQLAVFASPVAATGVDLHRYWDGRCASCHGHSGDFARRFLSVSDGELQGRHHTNDLRRFLHNHYAAGGDVDGIYDLLLAQAGSPARFKEECSSCHGTAAQFVRDHLELRDGVPCSRVSGRPTRDFLGHHRKLAPDDIDFFMEVLTRVAQEVYRP